MNELYSAMEQLLLLEFKIKALAYVLGTLEATFSEETQNDVKCIVDVTTGCLEPIQADLRHTIETIDSDILKLKNA